MYETSFYYLCFSKMTHNRYGVTILIVSISTMLGMMGCATSTGNGQSELLSDGYISYTEDSVFYIAHDSSIAGDPSNFTIYGEYAHEDSTSQFFDC